MTGIIWHNDTTQPPEENMWAIWIHEKKDMMATPIDGVPHVCLFQSLATVLFYAQSMKMDPDAIKLLLLTSPPRTVPTAVVSPVVSVCPRCGRYVMSIQEPGIYVCGGCGTWTPFAGIK